MIVELSDRDGDVKPVIPPDDKEALLINLILQIRLNEVWPGVGQVVAKTIEL
jgi:hypothetical protein